MTMDMVAFRAKAGRAAAYHRWKSKAELVIDAVAQLKRNQVDLDALPDTGKLRGDCLVCSSLPVRVRASGRCG